MESDKPAAADATFAGAMSAAGGKPGRKPAAAASAGAESPGAALPSGGNPAPPAAPAVTPPVAVDVLAGQAAAAALSARSQAATSPPAPPAVASGVSGADVAAQRRVAAGAAAIPGLDVAGSDAAAAPGSAVPAGAASDAATGAGFGKLLGLPDAEGAASGASSGKSAAVMMASVKVAKGPAPGAGKAVRAAVDGLPMTPSADAATATSGDALGNTLRAAAPVGTGAAGIADASAAGVAAVAAGVAGALTPGVGQVRNRGAAGDATTVGDIQATDAAGTAVTSGAGTSAAGALGAGSFAASGLAVGGTSREVLSPPVVRAAGVTGADLLAPAQGAVVEGEKRSANASAGASLTTDATAGLAQWGAANPLAGPTAAVPVPPTLQIHAGVDSAEFSQGLADRVSWMVGNGVNGAKIQVNPPQLGPIELSITVQGNHALIAMTSHSAVTRDALEASSPKLRDLLGAQGFGQVSVDISQRSFQDRPAFSSPYKQPDQSALRASGGAGAAVGAVAPVGGASLRAPLGALDAYA